MLTCMDYSIEILAGEGTVYKAILVLFFAVVCLTAILFTGLKDSFYSML
ncbi:hypothetical protein [Neobacillus sp. LXY-4]